MIVCAAGYVSCCCCIFWVLCTYFCFFFSSRRRHTRCALVTGVQTCALPISSIRHDSIWIRAHDPAAALAARRYQTEGHLILEVVDPFLDRTVVVELEIGRASCRERVCQYVWISVVAVSLKKKKKHYQ